MSSESTAASPSPPPGALLRRFARPRGAVERCDLCGAELPSEHQHLVEPATRKLNCVCDPCSFLLSNEPAARYRRVPRRVRFLPDFRLTDAQWDGLRIPINVAFFFQSTPAEKTVIIYPSPAGPTESLLEFEGWSELARDNPVLTEMEADTEALLVNRLGEIRDHFVAPIDECYKLVGLIRAQWQGLSGGTDVWQGIQRFFAALKQRSEVLQSQGRPRA
jgi:hypothetical protein